MLIYYLITLFQHEAIDFKNRRENTHCFSEKYIVENPPQHISSLGLCVGED